MTTRSKKLRLATVDKPPLRLVWVEAGSLAANPENWRTHPDHQVAAFKAQLAKVGWAGALLFNERTGRMIDGHLRAKAVPRGTPLPVLVGSWSAEDERLILATLDPLAAMAVPDASSLESLLAEVDLSEQGLESIESLLDAAVDRMESAEDRNVKSSASGPAAVGDRKKGERTIGIIIGQFHFEIPRRAYDAWLAAIEAKVSRDPDRVVSELKRRLKLDDGG